MKKKKNLQFYKKNYHDRFSITGATRAINSINYFLTRYTVNALVDYDNQATTQMSNRARKNLATCRVEERERDKKRGKKETEWINDDYPRSMSTNPLDYSGFEGRGRRSATNSSRSTEKSLRFLTGARLILVRSCWLRNMQISKLTVNHSTWLSNLPATTRDTLCMIV